MTDAEELAVYARRHWPRLVDDCLTVEEIGRALVTRASCGPRHWAGMRILRGLGLLAAASASTTPN